MYIYPFRFSKHVWDIPLQCHHQCTEQMCGTTLQYRNDDDDDHLIIEINVNDAFKDGRCPKFHSISYTFIHLASFSVSTPCGDAGALCNPDQLVIPDASFSVHLRFPLHRPTTFRIVKDTPGFTLRELLYLIQNLYRHIYMIEEQTATPQTYTVTRPCACADTDLTEALTSLATQSTDDTEQTCSICYMQLNETLVNNLTCNHTFHHECLMNWVTKGHGDKCPLCRQVLNECAVCHNDRIVTFDYTCVVLPEEYRRGSFRNRTNGVYQIYNYDYDQLILESMVYNRSRGELFLDMGIL